MHRYLFLLFLLPLVDYCQEGTPWIHQVTTHNTGTCEELQASNGWIYASTWKGLYVFDGWQSKMITEKDGLPENQTRSIFPSDSGIWIGFKRLGVWHYNPTEHRFTNFADTLLGYPKLPDYRVGRIYAVSDTGLWYQSHHFGIAFSYFNKPETRIFTPSTQIPNLSGRGINIIKNWVDHPKKPHHKIVYGSQGVYLFNTRSQKFLWHKEFDPSEAKNPNTITGFERIIRDMVIVDDSVYMATWGAGLLVSDLEFTSYRQVLIEPKYPISGARNNIRHLEKKPNNILQLSTSIGILNYDTKTGSLRHFKSLDGDAVVNKIWASTTNADGVWSITSDGLYLEPYDQPKYQYYPSTDAVIDVIKLGEDKVFSLYQEESAYISVTKGVSQKRYFESSSGSIPHVQHLHLYKDRIYGVSKSRIYIPSVGSKYPRKIPIIEPDDSPTTITTSFLDTLHGDIYMATKSGNIHRYNVATGYTQILTIPGRRQWLKKIIRKGDELVYVGEHGFGTITGNAVTYQDATPVFAKAGIPKDIFVGITNYKNTFYVATSKYGVLVLDAYLGFKDHIKLPATFIDNIQDISVLDSVIFLPGKNGLHTLDLATKSYQFKGSAYGIASLIWSKVINNKVWLGGYSGCFALDTSFLSYTLPKPKPFVQNISVMGSPTATDTKTLDLDYDENWVQISFGAQSWSPEHTVLHYRLLPQQNAWRAVNKLSEVSFPSLAAGQYELQVQAAHPTEPPVSETVLNITIAPAWYQTWWFRIGLGLSIMLSIITYYRIRIRSLIRKQQIKNQLHRLEMQVLRVQMNPHFLFNALNSVRFFVLKSDKKTASEYLAKFSRLLRFILNITTKDQISLAEELDGLEQYIAFEQTRFEGEFTFTSTLGDGIDPSRIAIQPLLIQPFVENAIWHGFQGLNRRAALHIGIERNANQLIITVNDNGIGRKAAEEKSKKAHASKALSITQDRLSAQGNKTGIQAGFTIEDKYQNHVPLGTRVTITLPYESFNR